MRRIASQLQFCFSSFKNSRWSSRDVVPSGMFPSLTLVILVICMLNNVMISRKIRKVTIFAWFSISLQFLTAITSYQYNAEFILPVIYTHTQFAFFTSLHDACFQNKLIVNHIQYLIIWYLMIIKNKLFCVTCLDALSLNLSVAYYFCLKY